MSNVHLTLSDVTTAGLHGKKPGTTTFAARDLERMPSRSLWDIATLAPGVYQRRSGDPIHISGGRQENTLVIIDGIPIY